MTYLPRSFRKLSFGERLKYLRAKSGETQLVASKRMEISLQYIRDMEGGRYDNPSLKIVLALCAGYGIPVQEMTEGL